MWTSIKLMDSNDDLFHIIILIWKKFYVNIIKWYNILDIELVIKLQNH